MPCPVWLFGRSLVPIVARPARRRRSQARGVSRGLSPDPATTGPPRSTPRARLPKMAAPAPSRYHQHAVFSTFEQVELKHYNGGAATLWLAGGVGGSIPPGALFVVLLLVLAVLGVAKNLTLAVGAGGSRKPVRERCARDSRGAVLAAAQACEQSRQKLRIQALVGRARAPSSLL
jgi:hypothetical protein